MNSTAQIKIAPSMRDYVFTLEHPNCIYNNVLGLTTYLNAHKDLERHTNVMAEYDLDYVLPSARYAQLIDLELEDQSYPWRIHSCHALAAKESIRIILRRASLIDLTADKISFSDYERRLYPIMHKYAEQFCDSGPIIGSSNVAVFRLDKGTGYYYLFTRVFDMWEYSDAHPEIGWRALDEVDNANTP
jgi:hypothetical protein